MDNVKLTPLLIEPETILHKHCFVLSRMATLQKLKKHRIDINSGHEDQGWGTRGPKVNTKSQNTDSFITKLHYRRLFCIVVQVSNTILLSLKC